jgi:DNA-binding SARP family transcriptional activator/tetratricopeptide (TPR) repeat protein
VIGIRVLGPLEADVDGAPADLGGPRQRCVLARLIAEHGRVVSADRLIEDLYADEAPPRALAAVQSYVSHLRRVLEPGRAAHTPARVLITAPPGYAVRLGPETVDAWSFEDDVHQAAVLADPAAAHARLSAALERWRGPALGEFGGLPWADLEASRLDELRLTAIEARAQAALRLGRASQTVAELSQLTASFPLREESWRLFALALYQSGRQGDALAALRRARARLATDLGVDPGPALRELEASILAQDPRLTAPEQHLLVRPQGSPGTAAAAGPPAGPAPYVGRDAELDLVTRTARQAAAGRLRVALVTGDPGTGKTALTDQLSQRLASEGWIVTAGRCPEHEGAPAGWPWAQALRRLAGVVPPDDPQALAALLTDTPSHDGDAAAARFRLHRAVAAYLGGVSRSAPLLVVLDDVHRADGESLAILADTTADLAASRILVLASYRPGEVGEQLSGCLATLAAREPLRVPLHGLDPAAASELIGATCTRPVDAETARTVAERTGGNPFFLREMIRLLDSEGALAATTEVPAGVRDVLQRRIARLPATAQTILKQAAVLGTETDVEVLADVAGAGEDVLLDAIEAGLFTGLVTEPGPGRVRFSHALVRDTLYQSLSRLRRSRLHARAAAAVERHSPAEVAALAHHFVQAGSEPAKAARYCGLAAGQAEQRFAYHEAARLWQQAVACFDDAGGGDARDRVELVLHQVQALAHVGQLDRARSCRRDAVRTALPLDDPLLLARVISSFDVPRLWLSNAYGETDTELVDTVEQTLVTLPPGDRPERCHLLTTLAFELHGTESERGYEASAQAVAMARGLGDTPTLMMAINGRYIQSYRHDGLAERRSLGAEMLALPGKPVTAEALGHLMLMRASCGTADFAAADMHADRAASIADRYDLPAFSGAVGMYRSLRLALDGDLAAARECYQLTAERLNKLDMWHSWTPLITAAWFCVRIMQDRPAEIAGDIGAEIRAQPEFGPDYLAAFSDVYALALAAIGLVAEARAVAAQRPPIRPDMFWLFHNAIRGLLGIAIDDHARAESAYDALLPFAGRPAGAETALLTLGPAAQVLGDLARYLERPGAEAHYRHALAVADGADCQLWREAALRRLGQA